MMVPKLLRLGSSSQTLEVNTHGTSGDAGWPSPSACVMAIGTRSYCPVHSFVVVVDMRALNPAHSSLLSN